MRVWVRICRVVTAILIVVSLGGCASFGRGVAQALLNPEKDEDVRLCKIEGEPFTGLDATLRLAQAQSGSTGRQTMRMLIIHGIGKHDENYAKPLVGRLARGLGLDRRDEQQKRIHLGRVLRNFGGLYIEQGLGTLLISRYTNADETRELLTFEVNWSRYHAKQRDKLVADDSDVERQRASINAQFKAFFNRQVVDPIKYIGDTAPLIRGHVRQASCWMISGDWEDYRSEPVGLSVDRRSVCYALDPEAPETARDYRQIIAEDEFVGVTHSLGSRIFLDAFSLPDADLSAVTVNPFNELRDVFNDKQITVIMLANQLPLLQLGLDADGFAATRLLTPEQWRALAPSGETLELGDVQIPWENSRRYNFDADHQNALLETGSDPASYGDFVRFMRLGGFPAFADRNTLCAQRAQRRFARMSLVTVTDPNDLLSYKLPQDFKNDYIDWALCPHFTDITISVTPAQDVFGLSFADPGRAHGNYWTDPGLAEILIRGFGDIQSHKSLPPGAAQPARDPKIAVEERGQRIVYDCKGTFHKG